MKSTILVPVLNERENLTSLLPALKPYSKKAKIIFVDNGSNDGSAEILEKLDWIHLVREEKKGFAEPLNRGLSAVETENIIFLDADTVPRRGWLEAMEKALLKHDIVVGETVSKVRDKKSKYGQISLLLFKDFSRRTARATTHALPWGPTCNLGVRKEVFTQVGGFSSGASGAFDIDWCWRAVLNGNTIFWEAKAVVDHWRRTEKAALLQQFVRYGRSEAWMQRAFSFLSEDEGNDSYENSLAAFRRLNQHPLAAKKASLKSELEELAHAFSLGVWEGSRWLKMDCPHQRKLPKKAIGWESGKQQVTVFVPGKGLTEFKGKWIELWKLWNNNASYTDLKNWIKKNQKYDHNSAQHFLEEWSEALTPAHVIGNKI